MLIRDTTTNVIKFDGVEGSAIIDASPGNLNGQIASPFRPGLGRLAGLAGRGVDHPADRDRDDDESDQRRVAALRAHSTGFPNRPAGRATRTTMTIT